jgi:hypothetical protein
VLRNDPETAHEAEAMPAPPELLPENQRSYDLWQLVRDQVRPDGTGGYMKTPGRWVLPGYTLDLGVVTRVIDKLGLEDPEAELVKMKELYRVMKGKR